MAKFEISLELTGLKLSIKGERDQISQLSEAVGQQLSGLLTPTTTATQAALPPRVVEASSATPAETTDQGRTRNTASKASRKPRQQKDKPEEQITWRHNPEKWGNPSQQWGAGDKMLWLLLVLRTEANKQDLTAPEIYTTFNRSFKEAGLIVPKNATRELRKLKVHTPALLGETTTGSANRWFLTQEGIKRAEALVNQQLHPVQPSSNEPVSNGAAKASKA